MFQFDEHSHSFPKGCFNHYLENGLESQKNRQWRWYLGQKCYEVVHIEMPVRSFVNLPGAGEAWGGILMRLHPPYSKFHEWKHVEARWAHLMSLFQALMSQVMYPAYTPLPAQFFYLWWDENPRQLIQFLFPSGDLSNSSREHQDSGGLLFVSHLIQLLCQPLFRIRISGLKGWCRCQRGAWWYRVEWHTNQCTSTHTVDGSEIRGSSVEVGWISHCLQFFLHPRWSYNVSNIELKPFSHHDGRVENHLKGVTKTAVER